jgi:hypothetical protein
LVASHVINLPKFLVKILPRASKTFFFSKKSKNKLIQLLIIQLPMHMADLKNTFLTASQDAGNGIALGTKPVFSIHECSVLNKIKKTQFFANFGP